MKHAIVCKSESVFLSGTYLGKRIIKIVPEFIDLEGDEEFFTVEADDSLECDSYYWDKYYYSDFGTIRDINSHRPKNPERPILQENVLNVII